MCEANAYLLKDGKEELILEAVDTMEHDEDGKIRIANIFGEQKVLDAKLKKMSLVNQLFRVFLIRSQVVNLAGSWVVSYLSPSYS